MRYYILTPTIEMNPTSTEIASKENRVFRPKQVAKTPKPAPATDEPCERILLAIDVHLNKYVVRRQLDGLEPQPAQTFKTEHTFLGWAAKQTALAREVHSVYEAGPLGFCLHRKLAKLGIKSLVIKAKVLDEEGSRRKSDNLDTMGLIRDLDRYLRGNKKALRTVRIPTVAEELPRTETRLRQGLVKTRKRLESQGRGYLLFYGYHFQGAWWKERVWTKKVVPALEAPLRQILESLRTLLLELEAQVRKLTQSIEKAAPAELPKGLGALSSQILEHEIIDWERFERPKAVSSYTGLCPGENSTGSRERKLSITKQGNPVVRHVAVETAWRLIKFQPGYRAVLRFLRKIKHNWSAAARKRAIVALAREFMVDWWRIRTGRATAQELGLVMNPAAA